MNSVEGEELDVISGHRIQKGSAQVVISGDIILLNCRKIASECGELARVNTYQRRV
jgi:hypothetical protein